MKVKLICNTITAVLFFLQSGIIFAQNEEYRAEASIPSVELTGFYRLKITPDILPHIKPDYSDLRIINEDGEEIPYVLTAENASKIMKVFNTFPVVENRQEGKKSRVIIHNASKDTLSQIQLRIKNADVRKVVVLLGSNDRNKWFVIKDRFLLEGLYNDDETKITKSINFPPSDYDYFRFDISDSLSAPLSVIDAGYYDYAIEEGSYQELPVLAVNQTDSSDGKSYVQIAMNGRQFIDLLHLDFEGAEFFYRQAILAKKEEVKVKKRSVEYHFSSLHKEVVSSDRLNTWRLGNVRADTLYLLLENLDNQPITLKSVKSYQLLHYLNVKLEKGKKYKLLFKNSAAVKPRYDLVNFVDEIPVNSPILEVDEVDLKTKSSKKERILSLDKIWVWILLAAVFVVMLYMSRKMLGEMRKD